MKMFEKDELDRILNKIDGVLKNKTTVFLIGGLALIKHGAKTSTKDIDLVLAEKDDYQRLKDALGRLGYEPVQEKKEEYEALNAKVVMDHHEDPRFDIFLNEICGQLILSDDMVKRSEPIGEYDNLNLNVISREDIFIFKIAATRDRDMDDASFLFESGLDWQVIMSETKKQSEITGKKWFPLLYQCLEEFEEEYSLRSPFKEEIYRRALEQLEERIN